MFRPLSKAASCTSLTSMAWAVSVLAVAAPTAKAQPIELSSIEAGSGPGFALLGSIAGDSAGQVVSRAGDVNGDGIGDFLVGAPTSATPTGRATGVAYVVFGSTNTAPVELSALEEQVSSRGFAIFGQLIGDHAGEALAAAGDVNGDGLADVLVGAGMARVNGKNSVGRAYLVFGRTGNAPVWLSDVASGSSGAGFVLNGEKQNGELGAFVAGLGDVNGDGLGDIAVACGMLTTGWLNQVSPQVRAYVVFGRTATTAVDLSSVATGTSAAGFLIRRSDTSLESLALSGVGDINGDGLGDIAWIASGSTPLGVVWGRTSTSTVEWSSLNGNTHGFRLSLPTVGFPPKMTVAGAGDVNGDGFDDFVVGLPTFSSTGLSPVNAAGRALVQFGSTGTPSTAARLTIVADGTHDRLGTSVSGAGDLNGDGLCDVVVGAAGVDPATGIDAGRTYVVYGRTNPSTIATSDLLAGTGGYAINGTAPADLSGISVAGGSDMTGDGRPDLLVGTVRDVYPGMVQRGIAYALPSSIVQATSSTYVERIPAGNTPRWGIGTTSQGTDATSWVDSRAWVDFDAGPTTSPTTATITRGKEGVTGIALETIAAVRWTLTTQRSAYGNARVTLRYTDAEIAGLAEGNLAIMAAGSLAGPWQPLANPEVNVARNEVAGDAATALRLLPLYLVVADAGASQPTPPPRPTPTPAPTPIPGPANDSFANATVVTTSAGGDSTRSTREIGEPFHFSLVDSGSIWYRWTATASGPVRIHTCGSTLDTQLAVYTGDTLDDLTLVARNDQSPYCPDIFNQSMVGFVAQAGTTYQIAVCGYMDKEGPVAVTVETGNAVPTRPLNDDFASAKVLVTSIVGSNAGATREVAEPEHNNVDDSGSVWYRYTAPSAEAINLTTDGSSFDTVMAVYQGGSVSNLALVARNDVPPVGGLDTDAEVTFTPEAGATYNIAVAGFLGQTGTLKLAVRPASQVPVPPANDNFSAAATVVTTATGSNVNATLEYNEMLHNNLETTGTVWYRWRAPVGSTVTIDTCGSDFDTVMGVYTQGPYSPYFFNRLLLVGSSDDGTCPASPAASSVTFTAPAGWTYYIAVGGYPPATGNVVVNVTINTMAANGDANWDGIINVVDLTTIHNYVAFQSTMPGDGDVDNNGSITINDATLLREYIVNGVALP